MCGLFASVSVSMSMCARVHLCVTVQGRWDSVSGNVCVCVAGTVRVCSPGAVWHGGLEEGEWTSGCLLQHHLHTEQNHSYCKTKHIRVH